MSQPNEATSKFWSLQKNDLFARLKTSENGLTESEASARLQKDGPNSLRVLKKQSSAALFLNQFKSPITLLLLFAACLSAFLGETTNTWIIFFIILISATLSFWQEVGAKGAIEKLLSIIQLKTSVVREGKGYEIDVEKVVVGDVVSLSAGDIIPGDCFILESKDLFVNEASLTGETFPIEKTHDRLPEETPLSKRSNSLFMGSYVVSGTAKALVVKTGTHTEFGTIARHLTTVTNDTEFEKGIKKFGYLLMEVTLILVITIFAINIYFHRPAIESLLFSLALAVGLTPQLLPAIISINLSHGAKKMAQSKVIVKKLSSIENFGSMNILCSDKTGTLTEGIVEVKSFIPGSGSGTEKIQLYSYLNSYFETGFKNPIDAAILKVEKPDVSSYSKTDEIPYDFIRKRLSIVVNSPDGHILITKGAFANVLEVCTTIEVETNAVKEIDSEKAKLEKQFEELSRQGLRVMAVAYKLQGMDHVIDKEDESNMTFLGFIALYDPPKNGILETVKELRNLGVELKMITGDNPFIAAELGKQIFAKVPVVMTGVEMRTMSQEAFVNKVSTIDIFAEVEPNQKERILVALQKHNNVVGYLGDGINDASALHVADVGISVDTANDVAKESADIVLLNKDLDVLIAGVREGRKTFSNTLKYILMATSANFGNMFSMAGASLFLPFLPLLPSQILLTNLLTDLPEMTIANDNVDRSMIDQPRQWNLAFIKKFMIAFGLISSVFDFATFGVLLLLLKAGPAEFRAGWFVESVVSASLILLVVRSPLSIFKSRPGKYLLMTSLLVALTSAVLPFSPLADVLGFTALPFNYMVALVVIVLLYISSTEILKRFLYK